MRRSRATDSTGYLWVEDGEPKEGMVAEVAPVLPVAHTYSFTVPPSMEAALSLGQRVMVPLGRRGRPTVGFVVGLDRRAWDSTLRPVGSLVDAGSFLTADLIELGREISAHYCCPLGQTLKAITPEAVRKQRGLSKVRYARLIRTPDEIRADGKRIGAKRQAVIEALSGSPEPIRMEELLRQTASSVGILQAMSKDGWVEVSVRHELQAEDEADGPAVEPSFELNEEQRSALGQINAAIEADRFSVTLLFGVSGCGKTEVYIQAMRRVLEAGRQAILLVPEIVLTTQLVGRLAARFPRVAVNHSGLTEAARSLQWRRIAAGDKQVVIGTRSAVFAPCPKLGLICVDEEQETSFKNLQAPRFHVRDVAIMRGKQLDIPIVLGSATPSLETWYKSEHRADYRRLVIQRLAHAQSTHRGHGKRICRTEARRGFFADHGEALRGNAFARRAGIDLDEPPGVCTPRVLSGVPNAADLSELQCRTGRPYRDRAVDLSLLSMPRGDADCLPECDLRGEARAGRTGDAADRDPSHGAVPQGPHSAGGQ